MTVTSGKTQIYRWVALPRNEILKTPLIENQIRGLSNPSLSPQIKSSSGKTLKYILESKITFLNRFLRSAETSNSSPDIRLGGDEGQVWWFPDVTCWTQGRSASNLLSASETDSYYDERGPFSQKGYKEKVVKSLRPIIHRRICTDFHVYIQNS